MTGPIVWDIPTVVPWNVHFIENKCITVSAIEDKKTKTKNKNKNQTYTSGKITWNIEKKCFYKDFFIDIWAHNVLY